MSDEYMRACIRCGIEKDENNFSFDKSRKSGLH